MSLFALEYKLELCNKGAIKGGINLSKYFGNPDFDADGMKLLTSTDGPFPDMMMNISVHQIRKGAALKLNKEKEETAVLLISGDVTFRWEEQTANAVREDPFKGDAVCLHVAKGVAVTVEALEDSEVLVQSVENDGVFASMLYTPETTPQGTFGKGQFEGKAERKVRTFFDCHNAPYSNMVIGDLTVPQGGWSSYPPHGHEQPEVYYYRFDKPQGFGASFVGEEVAIITDRGFASIPGGLTHPQVNAPGYPMYYVWMIRNFENNPWTERNYDPAHLWLLD